MELTLYYFAVVHDMPITIRESYKQGKHNDQNSQNLRLSILFSKRKNKKKNIQHTFSEQRHIGDGKTNKYTHMQTIPSTTLRILPQQIGDSIIVKPFKLLSILENKKFIFVHYLLPKPVTTSYNLCIKQAIWHFKPLSIPKCSCQE